MFTLIDIANHHRFIWWTSRSDDITLNEFDFGGTVYYISDAMIGWDEKLVIGIVEPNHSYSLSHHFEIIESRR